MEHLRRCRSSWRVIPLIPTRFRPDRRRSGDIGPWSGHLPFAHDLVAAFRPGLLVELGTHHGDSYFGFCQSVAANSVPCRCYAVDTWRGDSHAGWFDESVFQEVSAYNSSHFASFSILLRTTFDEASEQFEDQTIDLLHIDGLHTYEAVKHDFETWFPKVRPGGIILLHDTMARHVDFKVWKFWEELKDKFPSFEFTHSWGLGVLRKGAEESGDSEFVRTLFYGSPEDRNFIGHYYSTLSELLALENAAKLTHGLPAAFRLQAYPFLGQGYGEDSSVTVALEPERWERHTIALPQGSPGGSIRIDPVDAPCSVEIGEIRIKRAVNGETALAWTEAPEILSLACDAELIAVPDSDPAQFLSLGPNPKLFLPDLDEATAGQPLSVDVSVRISRMALFRHASEQLKKMLADAGRASEERDGARSEAQRALSAVESLRAELRSTQTERIAAIAEYKRLHGMQYSLAAELENARRATAREQDLRIQLESQVADARRQSADLLRSYSWQVTAPLRRVYELARRVLS